MTLQIHIERCCATYVDIETASEHVPGQVPNHRTRVQSLLDYIEVCTNSKICACVSNISNETNGMIDDWEAAVAHLLPDCSISKRARTKCKVGDIYGVDGGFKVGLRPKLGVELRYHKPPQYQLLSNEQKVKLKE